MRYIAMLTLPDFKEKKIVYIANYGEFPNELKFHNSNIRLYKEGKFVNQISCYLVLAIFIIGETTLTSVLIRRAQEFGFSLFLLNNSLVKYASILSKAEGNYKLRKIQYTTSQERELYIAKQIVLNKIDDQEKLLKQNKVDFSVNNIELKIKNAISINSLLGIEGGFASLYFRRIFKDIGWYRRAPRTKEDIPNLLLDIGYTFLFNYVDSLLNLFGFDTYKGFYHQLFFQRKSLSCDVIESMRPLIDRQLVKSYNLKQINDKDFTYENGVFAFKKGMDKKYAAIFFKVITDYKEDIYLYVMGFYRYLLNPVKYRFPVFKIR